MGSSLSGNRMKLLFVVPYAPGPIRVRPYSIIRELAARGHRVTVAANWSEIAEGDYLRRLGEEVDQVWSEHLSRRRSVWNCLRALPSRKPLQSVYCWNPRLAARIQRGLSLATTEDPFDIVHVEHLRGAAYGLGLQSQANGKRRRGGPPIVWDSVDCISLLFEKASLGGRRLDSRLVTRLELGRTKRFERRLLTAFQHVLVSSPIDRQAFMSLAPEGRTARISVLTNGVDLERFSPPKRNARVPNSIVLSGKMSYHANHSMVDHFLDRILPLIRAEVPDVQIWIVGKDPARSVRERGRQSGIKVTGEVPYIEQYLRTASLAAAPILYGVGIQNKVLEAMACATPVIASSQAVSALEAVPGRDVLIGDQPAEFARAAVELLRSPEKREALGGAGRQFVERRHSWAMVAKALEGIYDADRISTP
jgi:glycosyltransferase involved in cell wall biosynthesis